MKTKLITLLLLISIGRVCGQSKSYSDATSATSAATQNNLLIGRSTLVPNIFIINDPNLNNPWLTISGKPTCNNPDSLILYVNKKQLTWINDSTAVIKKK